MSGEHRERLGRRRWMVRAATLALTMVMASMVVLAASPDGSSAEPERRILTRPRAGLAALELSAEQLQQIREIRQKAYEKAIPIQGELYTLRRQLALALRGTELEADRVKELAARIHELQGELQQIQLQMLLDVRGVLTDEQLRKLSVYGGFGFGWGGALDGRHMGPNGNLRLHMMGRRMLR
ncbi:MAG TPA: periplasmic heavy metal sensor [Limnochordales bacterium]